MKSKIIILILFICLLYSGGRYIYYGSLTRNCIYTEDIISVPEQLIDSEIIVVKDAYLAIGIDREYSCLENIGSIANEIVDPESINNITVGRNYFTSRGLIVESLKKGTIFKIVDIIRVVKHGITTIDSGLGPIYHLILKDQNDMLYQIATVSLGINKDDLFLSLVDPSQLSDSPIKLLSPDSFDEVVDSEGNISLEYTGVLIELTESYLEDTEPQWKRLADRLERGENFLINVSIMLRDNLFREIKLLDNEEDRSKQMAEIHEEFLSKIPKSIILNKVKKNSSWPDISMEANIDLLNYLVDNQVELKVELISELIELP